MLTSEVQLLRRLAKFVNGFADAFVRGGQVGNAERYVRRHSGLCDGYPYCETHLRAVISLVIPFG
jgi:hypothetical protein